jgi:hypothetical protein
MFWNLLIGLALLIIGYLIMPKPKQAKPKEVSELEAPTADSAKPIPFVFGDLTIKSPNFLGWWDKGYVRKTKKSNKK